MLPTNPHPMHDIDDELEQFEKKLTSFQKEFNPTAEFTARMSKRLQRHDVLMREAAHEGGSRGFWMFLGTRTYAAITAFVFVLFTGGVSTFAYTNDNVTNGNPLYPVKRGLEKIEETFAGSTPEAHAEFQVKMLGRRLAESRNLTLNGIIDESTSNEVSSVVDNGIQAIQAVEKSDYRDQLLDRVTTMLKNEEKRIYDTAGVPYPTQVSVPAAVAVPVVMPAVSAPVPTTTIMVNPAVIPQIVSPSIPVNATSSRDDESAKNKKSIERIQIEQNEKFRNDEPVVNYDPPGSTALPGSTATSAKYAISSPEREDNVPTSLGAPSDMMDALEKHSKNLRQIELRVTQVRRR